MCKAVWQYLVCIFEPLARWQALLGRPQDGAVAAAWGSAGRFRQRILKSPSRSYSNRSSLSFHPSGSQLRA